MAPGPHSGGVLTDSVLTKQKNPADQKDASSGAVQSSVSALAGVSALPGAGGDVSNPAQQNLNRSCAGAPARVARCP